MQARRRAPITVSTLKEAEQFFAAGFTDILYAVGIAPRKLARVRALRQRGCRARPARRQLEAAQAVIARDGRAAHFAVLIEIDTDGHRAGVKPGRRSPARHRRRARTPAARAARA